MKALAITRPRPVLTRLAPLALRLTRQRYRNYAKHCRFLGDPLELARIG